MGSIPYCTCFEKKSQIITVKSDIEVNNIENFSNCYSKEKRDTTNRDYENNKITLSPQYNFINPLPKIVIIKHKNI